MTVSPCQHFAVRKPSWRAARHFSERGRSLCVLCRACAVSWQHPGAFGVPAGRLHISWVWKLMVVQAKELEDSQPGLCQVESRMEVTHEFCLRTISAWCSTVL